MFFEVKKKKKNLKDLTESFPDLDNLKKAKC